jgi:hypothetical protein
MRRAAQGFCSLSQVRWAGQDLRDAATARLVLAGFDFAVPCLLVCTVLSGRLASAEAG